MRRLRTDRRLTQVDVAEPFYTAAYISTIEAGRREPSPKAIAHFAAKLGVDPEELTTGRPTELPAKLAIDLQHANEALYNGGYDQADETFKRVAKEASPYAMNRVQAKSRVGRGVVAERQGRSEEALAHFEAASDLVATEPPPIRVEATVGRARCLQMVGDVRYALHVLETYLLILEKERLPDPAALMRTYSSLIWPYTEVGLYGKANEAATSALALEAKVDDPEQIASMHFNVARELLRIGRAEDALESLRRAEELYARLNWKTEIARAHVNRGIVFADQADLETARSELQSALQLIEGTSSVLMQARALNELARVERLSKNAAAAKELLDESISLLRDGNIAELALAHRELARCNIDDAPEIAEKHFRTAIDLYTRSEEMLQVAGTHRELGDLLCATGNEVAGRETYREGLLALVPSV